MVFSKTLLQVFWFSGSLSWISELLINLILEDIENHPKHVPLAIKKKEKWIFDYQLQGKNEQFSQILRSIWKEKMRNQFDYIWEGKERRTSTGINKFQHYFKTAHLQYTAGIGLYVHLGPLPNIKMMGNQKWNNEK